MNYKIKYVTSLGQEIDLMKYPYLVDIDQQDLFDYSLDFTSTDNPFDNTSKVSKFGLKGRSKKLRIQVVSNSKADKINEFEYAINYDVEHLTPGKLYVNDYYVKCYIVQSEPDDFEKYNRLQVIDYKLYFETGKWIKEVKNDYIGYEQRESSGSFKFPFSFPFSFGSIKSNVYLQNDNYASSKLGLIIYGPCTDPFIKINAITYGITGELLEGERFEVNPYDRTIYKINVLGEKLNVFDKRYKQTSIFSLVPIGKNKIEFSSSFSLTAILYNERNNPKWK